MTSRSDRIFIQPRARRAAVAFAVYMITGIGCVIAASPTGVRELIPVGFGIGLWAIAFGMADTINPRRQRPLEVLSVLAIGCAIAATALAAVQVEGLAKVLGAIVFISGGAALWITARAN
jgi:peptidoglycan/LPS O-acetylase OafA/YrhL